MLGVYFDGKARLRRDLPSPARGEALIAVRLAGVCRTDLEILKGYMGFRGVLGHEFVGEWNGRRVVGEINCACGRCGPCARGMPSHCRGRTVLGISGRDGAFAQYLCLPESNLHEVPEGVTDEEAVFTEPLAAALRVAEQVDLSGAGVCVLGDGRLGLLTALALRPLCRELLLVGRHEDKLRIASGQGVRTTAEFRPRKDWDVVVDATGGAEGFSLALSAVRPLGTVVLKSTAAAGGDLNLAPVVIDEVKVVGSRCGPFKKALELLASGRIDVRPLISGRYPLKDGLKALEAAEKGALKVLISIQ
jgi:threonine dehydrogenase-like Zn-dependent dehydrogenase